MPLYDFTCGNCGTTFESFSSMAERENSKDCPECDGRATVILSPVRCKLDGTTGDFPGEYMKWEKKRAQKMAQEVKKENS